VAVAISRRRVALRVQLSEPNVCPFVERTLCGNAVRQNQQIRQKGRSNSRLGLEIARQWVPVNQPLASYNASRLALCENIQ
jgi:hypothetical protein